MFRSDSGQDSHAADAGIMFPVVALIGVRFIMLVVVKPLSQPVVMPFNLLRPVVVVTVVIFTIAMLISSE